MGNLLETVDSVKLENQREVVKNERRQGVDNQPYGTWVERTQAALYPATHPYNHSVIGSMADLSAATVADVHNFFKTYYAPNNAVVVIAGDIDVPSAKALVRKHFGAIPRGPAVPALANMTVPNLLGSEQRFVVDDALAPAPAVFVAYRVPPAKDKRGPVVDLLGSVIGSGRSSRLYDALVRKHQVATQVGGFNFGFVDGADMLVFNAIGKPGASADSLEKALVAELANVGGNFTQAELDRVRAQERFNFVNGLQFTGGFGGRADRLAEGWTHYRDANHVNKVLGEFDRVTLAELNALARERLVPANRVVAVYQPVKKPAATTSSSEMK
jgi:predicted Zn-dependent peptidase